MAIIVSLAGTGVAACPQFPGPRAPASAGPNAYTTTGHIKKVPPPSRHVPIPEGPIESVRIRLDRSECYGTCPSYSVEIRGGGQARYDGKAYTLVAGKHQFNLPPETVHCLLEDFHSIDFWSLATTYQAPVSDLPTTLLTLEIGGRKKSLRDYAGRWVGMPPAVTDLEDAIQLAAAERWVAGDSTTVPSLKAEQFDFHSPLGAESLANAANLDNPGVALALLAAGAPANGHAFGRHDEQGPTAVEAAASHGRADVVRALIAAGALAGSEPGLAEKSLRAAATAGDPATVAEILKQHPNVNARDEEGKTMLMGVGDWPPDPKPDDQARRTAAVVRALLSAGADARLRDVSDNSALFETESAEAVPMLLAAGAELERRNEDGDTPLTAAGDDDTAMALIEAGADIMALNDKGAGLYAKSIHYKIPRVLAYLAAPGVSGPTPTAKAPVWPPDLPGLKRQNFNFHSRQAAVMLIRAANEGRDQLVLGLLEAGAPPNQVSSYSDLSHSRSAIAAASRLGNVDLVRALIAAGAFVDAPYHAKESALDAAVAVPQPAVVAEFLKTGVDTNAADEALVAVGSTLPDHTADEARWKTASVETTRLLLAAKANPRRADGHGDAALHHARSAEAVKLLVQAGADLEARNNDGDTPLLTTFYDDAAMAMIQAGADITVTDGVGNAVLDHATEFKLTRTLAYLHAHGIKR